MPRNNNRPSGGGGSNKPSGGGGSNRPSGGGGSNRPSGGGGGSTIRVAGQTINVGKKFGAGDIGRVQQIAPDINLEALKSKVQGKDIKIGSGAKTIFGTAAAAQREQEAANQREIFQEILDTWSTDNGFTGGGSSDVPEGYVSLAEYEAGLQQSNLDTQKQIEGLRQAGQTERQKLVNENNLAVTAAEVKGKLDLQGIINAGYKNIANIERGSNMFSSLMNAFNF